MRLAAEDLIGAGAIIHYLSGSKSREAKLAVASFEGARDDLLSYLSNCVSGKELIARGFSEDIKLAAALNQSAHVPVLQDGAYISHEW